MRSKKVGKTQLARNEVVMLIPFIRLVPPRRGDVVNCCILFWRRGLTGGCKKVQYPTGNLKS